VDEDFRIEPLGFLRLLRDTSRGPTYVSKGLQCISDFAFNLSAINFLLLAYFTGCRLDFWFNYTVARTHTLTGTRYILRAVTGL